MIKVGVCGVGRWATEEHIPRLRTAGDFEVKSIFDSIPARRAYAQSEYQAKVFSDFKEFLRSGLDLVVLTTPSNTHYELAMEVLKQNINVVIEKPCTLSFDDSKKIFDFAKKKKLFATVYHNRRFDADYLTIKKVLNNKLIGDVFTVESRIVGFGTMYDFSTKDFDQRWRHKKLYGGGQLYDMGSHLIDQMLMLINLEPKSVWCEMKNIIWSEEVDSYFKLAIRFKGGMMGIIEDSQLSRYRLPRWYVLGTKGALLSEYWGAPVKIKIAKTENEEGEESLVDMEKDDWGRFYGNIRDVFNSKAPLLVKPEEVLNTSAVIDAAKLSNLRKIEIAL